MTDILLINPNTTQSITDLVLKTARRFAAKGTNLRAVTGTFGPRYIASRVGYAIAGARAVTIPGCDHFSMIAHGLFKASVFDFFDGWLE